MQQECSEHVRQITAAVGSTTAAQAAMKKQQSHKQQYQAHISNY
jgi:hypothetical protein